MTPDDNKLFLLDAYALIYRAYYALIRAPRVTTKGFNTSAIFGFCNTLTEILRKENPTHIAVCFDPHGPTFRHEAYPEYKADREAMPEDIRASLPYIKDIVKAWNIPIIEVPGYEADDVIGTLSRQAEREGMTTYMMTPDKDYGQLVTDKVLVYRPSLRGNDFEIRGVKEVCERHGISSPLQVIDLLALEGDAIDNIPGCPGVGEKTAQKLIAEWGTVERMLDNTDKLKGAVQRKVTENADQIRFSKFLATIKTDVPVEIDIASLRRQEPDIERLKEIYTELEFKTFIARLKGDTTPVEKAPAPVAAATAAEQPSLFDTPSLFDDAPQAAVAPAHPAVAASYVSATDADEAHRAIASALKNKLIGVAVYAYGPDAMTARWDGVALSTAEGHATYIPSKVIAGKESEILAPLFTSPDVTLVSHDVKRDIIVMRRLGIEITAGYYDTSVAHYLLQPEMRHTLPAVAAGYLGYHTADYAEDSKTRRKEPELTVPEATARIGEGADITLRLYHALSPLIEADGLTPLLCEIELPLVAVLADMEWTGVRVDVHVLAEQSRTLTARLHEMEARAYDLAGGEFNLGSPMQVGEILFDRLKIDTKAKRTKKGFYSTTEEILEKYRAAHPLVGLILDIRGLRKLLATYINSLPELINPATGKIHTSYNQTVTATGRISSANPNLQNIPIRTEDGREIRRAFIPDKGDIILSADYSQIELRLIADMARDEEMIDAFLSGADIHRATAAKIYHTPLADVTDDQRRHAKTANFGIIYGISAFGLAERLGIPRGEAKALIEGYFETFPHLKEYMTRSIEEAREKGYVTTVKGRKRYLPDIRSGNAVVRGYAERNAVNAPIQGSAADIIKIAMVAVDRDFKREGLRSRMIIQVHDELVFNVVPDELDRVREIVRRDMEDAYKGRVPLIVSDGTGHNWLEAH